MNNRITFILTLAMFAGCDRGGESTGSTTKPAAAAADESRVAATNRIDLPVSVRQNLGITFAKVERRRVAATLRVPGRFELLPSARREYRVTSAGEVELLVEQYAKVDAGTPLYRLHSAEWPKLRHELHEEQAVAAQAAAEVVTAEATRSEAQQAVAALERRIAALAEAGARRAELDAQLAERKASLPRLEAEVKAKRAAAEAASQRFPLTLASAASILGMTAAYLTEPVDGQPRWRSVDSIVVKATKPGVVEAFGVTSGSWAEQAQLAVATVDPQAVRFRASVLQVDVARLPDGAAATISPPSSASADGIPSRVAIGLEASADTRTAELIVTPDKPAPAWARAGVSSFAEIVTSTEAEPEAAIPLAAVVQDELARVYFRRDPKDPDKVIRVEGDFGTSDGRWVEVLSGLKPGDEVVLDGVYELKLTGGGKAGGGGGEKGHFHADGTWHAEGTPEPEK